MIATSTIIAVAAVATVAAAGVGAYSAIQAGQAQEASAKYNAAVANNNATAQRQQAEVEAARIRRRNLQVMGTQQANFAKSGVTISGSAQDVLYDSSVQGEMDALSALYTGKIGANNQKAAAGLYTMQGQNAATTSYFNAGSTILSGAGSAGSMYGNYNYARKSEE